MLELLRNIAALMRDVSATPAIPKSRSCSPTPHRLRLDDNEPAIRKGVWDCPCLRGMPECCWLCRKYI